MLCTNEAIRVHTSKMLTMLGCSADLTLMWPLASASGKKAAVAAATAVNAARASSEDGATLVAHAAMVPGSQQQGRSNR